MTHNTPLSNHREWAIKKLGLAPELSADEVSIQILNELQHSDFKPDSELREAIRILQNAAPTDIYQSYCHERLSAKLDELVAHFFELTPEQRHRELSELIAESKGAPGLTIRLQRLTLGVHIDPHVDPDETDSVHELAATLIDIFLVGPKKQAELRLKCAARLADGNRAMQEAAKRLLSHYRSIADLDRSFVKSLAMRSDDRYGLSAWKIYERLDRSGAFVWMLVLPCAAIGILLGMWDDQGKPEKPRAPDPQIGLRIPAELSLIGQRELTPEEKRVVLEFFRHSEVLQQLMFKGEQLEQFRKLMKEVRAELGEEKPTNSQEHQEDAKSADTPENAEVTNEPQ